MDLIINTFGTSLTRENDNFLVIHQDGKQKIHPDKIKTILVSRGALISSDATLLAIENEIDILFIDKSGDPIGRVWSVRYGSISTIRHKQLDFTFSIQASAWIKEILMEKTGNQIAILLSFQNGDSITAEKVKTAIRKLNDYKKKIEDLKPDIISELAPSLRGWEGAAGKLYFETLNLFLPEKYQTKGRSQHPATDLLNCLLNYGYGILYGKIEGALIKAGVDPYIGIFHREDYNRPVLVFDVIEKYRVWIDYVILSIIMQEVINEDCYAIKSDSSIWLEGLGKRILIQSVNDYLEEVINLKGVERSRKVHLELYAQKMAKMFMDFKPDQYDNGRFSDHSTE